MYESNEATELYNYLSDVEVRHLYLDSSIRNVLSMQLRSMRAERGWSQTEVGEKAGGMKQSAINRLEDPRYGNMSLSTLKRLAEAFDVALSIRFSPFSEFIDWVVKLDENKFAPPSYNDDISPYVQLTPNESIVIDANVSEPNYDTPRKEHDNAQNFASAAC
ncbi:MAG: helix-turn-helix transcriptional regulator [bacterium]|nr:helix-turn-helix transcriptional regulator [bacterium]